MGGGGLQELSSHSLQGKDQVERIFCCWKMNTLEQRQSRFQVHKVKVPERDHNFKEMSSNLCEEFSTFLQINWFTGLHQMVHLMDHKWGIFYNIPNCVGASTQRDHVVIKLFRNISWEETFEMKLDLKSTVIKTKGEVAKKKRREEGVAGGGWGRELDYARSCRV